MRTRGRESDQASPLITSTASLLVFLLCLASSNPCLADSATQSDWSGGGGILGPVVDWGNGFWVATNLDYDTQVGELRLEAGVGEFLIEDAFLAPRSVAAADIDCDGKMDVVAATFNTSAGLCWLKNVDGLGIYWEYSSIDSTIWCIEAVDIADLALDGDPDVIAGASFDYEAAYWENLDGVGGSWAKIPLDDNFNARSIRAIDMDSDGDEDVLGTAWATGDIVWWENRLQQGLPWVKHYVDGAFQGATWAEAANIDGDGDIDVVACSNTLDEIAWWESNTVTPWIKHEITDAFYDAGCLCVADFDGDADPDVACCRRTSSGSVRWWENVDGVGGSWTEKLVEYEFGGWTIIADDIDADGDQDLLGASYTADEIVWWENEDGLGSNWTKHIVSEGLTDARAVHTADMNKDGILDILGAAEDDNEILWWQLGGYVGEGSLISSILDTQADVVQWGYLWWSCTQPPSTQVSFKVRGSDDPDNMGSWSPEYTDPGAFLGDVLDINDRYFQYQVTLSTDNAYNTPSLLDVTATWSQTAVESGGDAPQVTELLGPASNPCAGPVLIQFALAEAAHVDLEIFNLAGRLACDAVSSSFQAGSYEVQVEDLAPGVYFARMTADGSQESVRFVVLR